MISGITEQDETIKAFIAGEQRERSRIGRELHDGIGAMLFSVSRQLQHFTQQAGAQEQEMIGRIMDLVQETGRSLRNTVHNLIPEIVALKGIQESLTLYLQQINPGSYPEIALYCCGNWQEVSPAVQHAVFRMAQELVRNMIQHAQASGGSLTLEYRDNSIRLFAEDNGCGFNPEQITEGSGLHYLRCRVQLLQGTMELESSPGKGMACTITINL